ncbi:MAG: Ig-like domain-containing protein [Planktothrix sp. GU0601_MAG3]|nr:MAG: Ig-like domain-containing protein [Planktothrix sp. GU0601_MAG3]
MSEDTSISLPGVSGSSVAWSDYTGDGKPDFLLTGWGSSGPISKLYKNASDTTPPTASSFTPADNATGVAVGANLIVNFSEAIQKGTGNIVIKKVSDNSLVETIQVTATNVTVSGTQLTINPTADLAQGTDYYVEIANGTIEDLASNDYAGIIGNSTWNFKTQGTPTINGTADNDILMGTANSEIINGLAGNDQILGLASNDSLNGGDGHDSLDGSAGADQLQGQAGDDIYTVDNAGDMVTESASQGRDLVQSFITYTLPVNVEDLTLAGSAVINGTGNSLNNSIIGNNANNTLNGSTGADLLVGRAGNDTYLVENASDVVAEALSEGTDLVQSSVTYNLPANVENLTLTGTTAINGIGNTLANLMTGNTVNNILNGSTGADQLKGGTGNDTYVVDNLGDVVTELASAGTDLVQSSVTYTLPVEVENLTLTGTTAINGTGNTLANMITGNTANNILNGGDGNDSLSGGAANDPLTGGLGADKFIYDTNAAFATSAVGVDTITDFTIGQGDKIVLDKTTFTSISSIPGTGFSIANEFAKVTTDALAATSAADIVYNTATGGLFYNQNGTAAGFGTGAKFLTLTNKPALTASQFLIQA